LPGLANASPSAQDAVGGLTIAVKSSGLTMAYTNVNLATGTTDVRARPSWRSRTRVPTRS
jgi:hypothetical protein